MDNRGEVLVIGAGPAGLTAAYELSRHGITGTVVEADSVVGGIARTVERDGYRFDIGGHRFFTKVKEIEQLWDEMLGEPMMTRPRLSRIFYDGKFYDYPLKAFNAVRNMGPLTALACVASYGMARLRPIAEPRNFEEWVTNHFGSRLYRMFFKSYTEKVWGVPCTEIGADWAAQRIKGLNLSEAIRNAIFGQRNGKTIKTLIDEFRYPRLGPGQLWEAAANKIQQRGWTLRMRTRVIGLERNRHGVHTVVVQDGDARDLRIAASQIFASMPLRELILCMKPPAPDEVIEAAESLTYRDFLTVALVLEGEELFPDNWIYIHSPEVRVGRIQNFKNWSPHMVPDPSTTCLGLEYFVNEGDALWSSPDDALVNLGYQELRRIGLAQGRLLKGYVVRMPKAYPVYSPGYKQKLDVIRGWLRSIENLHCMGRNGQHRYNNQDHSMATALIAARNVAMADDRDPWAINEDAEYHEIAKTERQAPETSMPHKGGILAEPEGHSEVAGNT